MGEAMSSSAGGRGDASSSGGDCSCADGDDGGGGCAGCAGASWRDGAAVAAVASPAAPVAAAAGSGVAASVTAPLLGSLTASSATGTGEAGCSWMLGSVGDESVVELIAGAAGLAAVAAAGDNPKSRRSAPGLVVPLREVLELASVSAGPTPPPVALGRSEAAIWSTGASSGLVMLVVAALAISSSSGWLSSVRWLLLLLLSRARSDGDAGTVEVAVEGLRRRPAISPPRKPKWSKWPLGLAAWCA